MKKADKIAAMLGQLAEPPSATSAEAADHAPVAYPPGLDPCYTGYFTCFNSQHYYEAHDVLEHLWLQTTDENHAFYKGLIQLAGAFVHLQKQYQRPDHPKDATRARPAVRLFQLAGRNLAPYRPLHLHLDVTHVCNLSTAMAHQIADSGYTNPWSPQSAPIINLRS